MFGHKMNWVWLGFRNKLRKTPTFYFSLDF